MCLWAEGCCAQILLVQQCWAPLEACPLLVPPVLCLSDTAPCPQSQLSPVLVPPQLNSPMNSVTSTEDIKPPLGLNGVLKVPAHPSGTMASFTKHICAICGDRSSGEAGTCPGRGLGHWARGCGGTARAGIGSLAPGSTGSASRSSPCLHGTGMWLCFTAGGEELSQETPGPCLALGSHPHPVGKQGTRGCLPSPHPWICTLTQCHVKRCS